MPHYLIRFTTDTDRVIKAASVKPECRDGVDVYVAYSRQRAVLAYFTAQNVLSVEETVLPRGSESSEE